jgi:serine/threonine protein kinase
MANEDERLAPGSVFAGFEVISVLGEGGFGAVYRAVHLDSGREVALKVLRTEVASNPEVVTRFLREAHAVAGLQHPNIVEAVDMGHCDGHPYLAMELLVGEPLTALMLREGALPLARALDILIPVMSAVRSVHDRGIVHRDLKPDNIFIVYTAGYAVHPKVLDFGFVKFDDSRTRITRNDTTIGTPNFMAPEQLHSPQGVDARADQWALGVLLYFLLSNSKPFAADTLVGTLKNVLHEEPAPLQSIRPDLPADVVMAVHRALSKIADDRFPSVHALAAALMPFTSDDTALIYTSEFCGEAIWDDVNERTGMQLVVGDDPYNDLTGEQHFEPEPTHEQPHPYAQIPVAAPESPYTLGPQAPHSLQPVVHGPTFSEPPPPPRSGGWVPIALAALVAIGLVAGALTFVQQSEEAHVATSPVPAATPDAATDAPDASQRPQP